MGFGQLDDRIPLPDIASAALLFLECRVYSDQSFILQIK